MIKPLKIIDVKPSVPEKLQALSEMSDNLWFAWNHECENLFKRMNPDLWEETRKNPVELLGRLRQEDLQTLANDDGFLAHLDRIRQEAADQGVDEVLIISRLRQGTEGLLSKPAVMHLLNVLNGERTLVWGLEFTNINDRVLKDILASTKERTLVQSIGSARGGEGVTYSVVAPDILVEEMILQGSELEKIKRPDPPMPGVGK